MTQHFYTTAGSKRKPRLHQLCTFQRPYYFVVKTHLFFVTLCNSFTPLSHSTVQRNGKVELCSVVVITGVALRQRIVTHVKWGERHCCTVTRITPSKLLSTRGTVVLELYSLICYVTRSCCHRVSVVANCWFFCFNRNYCENTESEVVVEVVSMSRVTSIVSTTPAARTTVSS